MDSGLHNHDRHRSAKHCPRTYEFRLDCGIQLIPLEMKPQLLIVPDNRIYTSRTQRHATVNIVYFLRVIPMSKGLVSWSLIIQPNLFFTIIIIINVSVYNSNPPTVCRMVHRESSHACYQNLGFGGYSNIEFRSG